MHTEHCHLVSDFLVLFSLLLCDNRTFSVDGSGRDRLLLDASGLLDLLKRLRSVLDVRISSFLMSSAISVGESRLMNGVCCCELQLFRELLHNISPFFEDSHDVSTNDVIDVCGVGLKLKLDRNTGNAIIERCFDI